MKSCLVCGSNRFTPIYKETLLQCQTCTFITANIEISPEILHEIYTENYFKGEEYLDYEKDKQSLQENFKRRVKAIVAQRGKKNVQSALEIGCAYGFFAEVFTKELPTSKYIGMDVVAEATDYGAHVLKQNTIYHDYLTFPAPTGLYSDVFMWDVIEHLSNPEDFLKKSHNEMVVGGCIYITTGDIGALLPRWQKSAWRMIHPPSHLQYFSAKTLSLLLESQGFKVKKIEYPAIWRSTKQIFYSLFMLNKKQNKIVDFFYKCIPNFNIPMNTFDIMLVTATKL